MSQKSNQQQKKSEPNDDNKDISFSLRDFRGPYDEEENKLTNFKPKPFILGKDPEMPLLCTISIYGKRKSGKSVAIKWLIQYFKPYFPWIWVFTKTKCNSWYEGFVPSKSIVQDFNEGTLQNIIDRQQKAIDIYLSLESPNSTFNPRAMIIWDDCMGKEILYNNTLNRYYYTGRHLASMNIFSAQVNTHPNPLQKTVNPKSQSSV